MSLRGADRLQRAMEATWPPARRWRDGPWTFRDGAGGGMRVSAATAEGPVGAAEVARALAAFRRRGAPALFQVRSGEGGLDHHLAEAGLAVLDPVLLYAAATASLSDRSGAVETRPADAPGAEQRALWAEAGIGPARLAVMARAPAPSAALTLTVAGVLVGTVFVAACEDVAMIHALEIAPEHRRRGAGGRLCRAAAQWAAAQGARHLGLAVTVANAPARALYASLGMGAVGRYHYRVEAVRDQ